MKTAQQVLDEGIAFILAQTDRCVVGVDDFSTRCAYITPEGQRCVAGNFMSEALCKAVEDRERGGSVGDVLIWIQDEESGFEDFLDDKKLLEEHLELLGLLQELHDNWEDRSQPARSLKVEHLAEHALQNGLVMPKHERLGNLSEVAS